METAMKNILKEMLGINKNALKYIHNKFGYDFNQPFEIFKIEGKFTANSLMKETGHSKGILMVVIRDRLYVCMVHYSNFIIEDDSFKCSLDVNTFILKRYFEDARKNNTIAFYIHQDKEYIAPPEIRKEPYWFNKSMDELDKSGYNITESRSDLNRRLVKYKSNKRKKEVDAIDFSDEIKELRDNYTKLKELVNNIVYSAESYDDFRLVRNIIDFNFSTLLDDIKDLEELNSEKLFNSISSVKGEINRISKIIRDKSETLYNCHINNKK